MRRNSARWFVGKFFGPAASLGALGAVLLAILVPGASGAAGQPNVDLAPTVTGTSQAGSTLTTSDGTWVGITPMTFTYQWQRCNPKGHDCDDIPNATTNTFTPMPEDISWRIRSVVTATNSSGTRAKNSEPTPPIGADTTPPSAPGGLRITATTATSLALSWIGATDGVGVTAYGLYRDQTLVTTSTAATTTYTFTGLTCGTAYNLGVDAVDAAGNRSAGGLVTATTAACGDTQAPTAPTGLTKTAATSTSIGVSWQASTDNAAVTAYEMYRNGTLAATSTGTTFTFPGLTCATSYVLAVDAVDAAGNRSPKASLTAATAPCPLTADTSAPTPPANVQLSGVTQTSISLSWSASTDNVGVVGYGAYRSGASVGSSVSTSYTFSGLSCGVSYTLAVDATDAAGNRSTKTQLTAATTACADAQPPAAPTALTISGSTATAITLSWSAATDNIGVVAYGKYLNGTLVATSAGTSYMYTGLTCGTTYTFAVDAVDAAGNRSTKGQIAAPTNACGDSQAPTSPTNLVPTGSTTTSITLSWSASTDNVGVTGYGKYLNSGLLTTSSATTFTFSGLSCGTAYALAVDATDAAGNRSARTQITSSTSACPPSGPAAAYAFDEGSGSATADSSGNGNVGTATGTSWSTAGKFGSALSFNGAGSLVTATDSPSLDLVGGVTMEAWVFPTAAPSGFASILAKERTGGGMPYGLETVNGGATAWVNVGATHTVTDSSTLPLNTWTHVAGTYDGATLKLYSNGTLVGSESVSGFIFASADPLDIGGNTTWSEYFAGRIDNVRIYNRALTQSEVQTDMNRPIGTASPAPTDGSPPTVPGGLSTSSTTTSITLSWNASTDDVSVAGYDLFKNGVSSGSTPQTNYTFTGLLCGTTYTLAVDSYDGAGNRSARASLGATTSACAAPPPSSGASVFVSPSGSDSNPCTQAAPCQSFDRAYHVAQQGQVVQVAGGTYGSQSLLYDASKTGSAHVVFQPAAAATVSIGDLTFGPTRFVRGASHVTVSGITVTGDVQVVGCGTTSDSSACQPESSSGGDDITLTNLRVTGEYAFYCASCSDVSIIGGVWGPPTYQCRAGFGSAHPEVQNAYLQKKRSHGILIDGAIFQNFARCSGSDHTECMQMEPVDDLTIRDSTFRKCDTIVVNLANDLAFDSKSAAGYEAPNNVLIENNFFDESADYTGGPTYYALNIRECTNCTIRYNSWLQAPRMPTGQISLNNKYIGNVGPMEQAGCGTPGVMFSRNVWKGAQCSSSDLNVTTLGFLNSTPGTFDLHLATTSPAINRGDPANYPTSDIDGQARPLGGTPDAGADEKG